MKTRRQRWVSFLSGGPPVANRGGRSRLASRLAAAGAAAVAVGCVVTLPESGASAQSSHRLVGTFKITPGSCNPITKTAAGSYFRLIFPKGNILFGPFFQNSTSPCFDKSYTTISPGTQGGLVTGAFQPGPPRAFTDERRRPCPGDHSTGVRSQPLLSRLRPNRVTPRRSSRSRARPSPRTGSRLTGTSKPSRLHGRTSTSIKARPNPAGGVPALPCRSRGDLQRRDACLHDSTGPARSSGDPSPASSANGTWWESSSRSGRNPISQKPTTSVDRAWRAGGSVKPISCSAF